MTFLMTSHQYVISAMAYSFGFTYRKHWAKNYLFVGLAIGFTIIHYYIVLVPSHLSCFFRINCDNEDNVAYSFYAEGSVPIQNPYNTTLMPEDFRRFLAILITVNLFAALGWEYYIVGKGYGKKLWNALFGGPVSGESSSSLEKQHGTFDTKESHEE